MLSAPVLTLALLAFLIGSLPTGYLVGRLYGIDIRKQGSGNIGATNARRVLGRRAGLLTLIVDILKGVLAVSLGWSGAQELWLGEHARECRALFGVCAILGHCYSPFLRFKGGKGVATGLGVFLVLAPGAAAAAAAMFVLGYSMTSYASVGSIAAAAALPPAILSGWFGSGETPELYAACAAAAIVITNHRANIRRLIKRQELKAGRAKNKAGAGEF